MIWLSDRNGLHGDDGNEGDPQLDIYEAFYTQEALNRFHLSPAEYEIEKASEGRAKEKKNEGKTKEEKENENRPPDLEPITVDLSRIEDRMVRLTLGSSRIVYAALSKDGD